MQIMNDIHRLVTGDKRCVQPEVGGGQLPAAELGQSLQVGSPGRDGQLHGLLFRVGTEQRKLSPEVPSHQGRESGGGGC